MQNRIIIDQAANGYLITQVKDGKTTINVYAETDDAYTEVGHLMGTAPTIASPEKEEKSPEEEAPTTTKKKKKKKKAAKPAPVVEAEDDDLLEDDDDLLEDAPEERTITKDELKDMFNQVIKKSGSDGQVKIKSLFKDFGAAKLSEIKEENYSELYGKAEELLAK